MENLLMQLIEKVKQNKTTFRKLKELTVDCQQYELAANLREIEKELFPESEEVKQAKETASKLNLLFRMVDINVPEDLCWLINETIRKRNELGDDKFSIQDASDLVIKRKRIFSE